GALSGSCAMTPILRRGPTACDSTVWTSGGKRWDRGSISIESTWATKPQGAESSSSDRGEVVRSGSPPYDRHPVVCRLSQNRIMTRGSHPSRAAAAPDDAAAAVESVVGRGFPCPHPYRIPIRFLRRWVSGLLHC